jgi:nucleoside-diphosphate-sugar epimerase
MNIENQSILVSGGAGAIGSNLVKRLLELNPEKVIVLDDFSSSYAWNLQSHPKLMVIEGSVTDDLVLKRVFLEKPQIVFHLAAFFANQNSVDFPEKDLLVNGFGTLKMLEYSQMTQVRKFIYASSGCSIYGGTTPLPLREEFMSMKLSTPYQITKMLGELYTNFYASHYNMDVVKARFFNSFGPGEVPGQYRNVIPNFIYWAMKKLPLPITGNIKATRDFTYVEDLIDGLIRMVQSEKSNGEEFNLAGGKEVEIGKLAHLINEITGNKAGIKIVDQRKWDTKSRVLASVDKAKDLLNYEPKVDFEVGLRKTINWFQENWEKIDENASFPAGMSSAVRQQKTK